MSTPSSSAVRALALEYKSLQEEPVEGFRVKLLNDDNLFEWEVAIFGPPDTLYQGGYFKVSITFLIALFIWPMPEIWRKVRLFPRMSVQINVSILKMHFRGIRLVSGKARGPYPKIDPKMWLYLAEVKY